MATFLEGTLMHHEKACLGRDDICTPTLDHGGIRTFFVENLDDVVGESPVPTITTFLPVTSLERGAS